MGRPLACLVVLAALVLLGGCLEMAPRSSVPFQAAADRQTRYAAEIALAIKENRHLEVSEAAANGRMVLPQLPEIWGPPGPDQRSGRVALGLEPGGAGLPAGDRCALPPVEASGEPGRPLPADCREDWWSGALALPPPGYASIAPAATAPPR